VHYNVIAWALGSGYQERKQRNEKKNQEQEYATIWMPKAMAGRYVWLTF